MKYCQNCGFVGEPKQNTPGTLSMEVTLCDRRQLSLSISDNYFSLSTTITSFFIGVISPRLG
jgi:hypothetical protein